MPIAKPPPGASNGELVRWTFEVLDDHDVSALRTVWTDATVAESGEDVFVQWHLTVTHTGAPFEGIEATGRALAIDGMDHVVIRDGTIATNTARLRRR